jgi:hypothetical protein
MGYFLHFQLRSYFTSAYPKITIFENLEVTALGGSVMPKPSVMNRIASQRRFNQAQKEE